MIQIDIRDVVRLENTRPLYSAVENLHRGFLMGHNTPTDIDRRPEAIKSFCADELKAAEKPNHPYANFRRFLRNDLLTDDDNALADTAAKLLCLYDALDCLGSESLPQEEYPDVFEYLCNSMRRIMDSSVCYLLYSQRNHIELLSTSVFPESMVSGNSPEEKPDKPLTENDFHRIRRHIHRIRSGRAGAEDKGSWSIADTVYHLEMKDLNLITLVIDFPRYPKEQWKDEFLYLIFRQDKPFPTPQRGDWDRLILNLRNVLFLRNQLLEQCMGKLYILMAGQRSYQYVKRLSKPSEPLRILHLTDLHISEGTEEPMEQFLELLEEHPHQVDLLAITGDVIQGSDSAGTMEDRYRQAARFIRQIAAKLWSTSGENGEKLVRTDWFKRILIVPGNHDYATMNDLKSMSLPGEPRATALGYATRKEGGTMVKFAYYIKFLCDLLDLDITELVRNDLNESRRYLRMGLTVYGLNTVSEIGPLRTNKVALNLDAALRLVKAREPRNRFNLILSHHGPCYKIDYLMDRYGIWDQQIPPETQSAWIDRFLDALEKYDRSQKTAEDQKECSDALTKLRRKIRKKLQEAGLSQMPCTLLDHISDAIRDLKNREQLTNLQNGPFQDRDMMAEDQQFLDHAFRELMRRIGFHMCLSGHTHAHSSDFYPDPLTPDKTQILCVEGDRMFDGDKLHYAIVEIDDQEHRVCWTGYTDESSHPPLVSTF